MFEALSAPLKIGPVNVRNRTYTTAHGLGYAEPIPGESAVMLPSEKHVYYYAERAKGGVGLIVSEAMWVHPSSDSFFLPAAYDRRVIPGLRKITDAVHSHGARIFAELSHAGHHAHNARSMLPALSSSQTADLASGTTPKEMDLKDIKVIQEGFVLSTGNCLEAGYDGIEVHASHSYLIEQFLSPFYNKRRDSYGGSTENRLRFLLEILTAIREKYGRNFALGIRLNAEEFLPGGLSGEDMKPIARTLEDSDLLDFLDVHIGTYHQMPLHLAPMSIGPLHQVEYISEIKKAVRNIPVLGCAGRLTDPRDAERIITEGQMDMVGGARLFIADPEWSTKALEGRLEDIIECIACNYCIVRELTMENAGIGCTINPITGREKELGEGTLKRSQKRLKVAVVGAGPAGLEASRVALLRGHDVTVYEKLDEIGGHLYLEAKLPAKDVFLKTVNWYGNQLRKLGVKPTTGTMVTDDLILNGSFDAIVLATGATYSKSGASGFIPVPITGSESKHVINPEDVLDGTADIGENVLVLDEERDYMAPDLALFLAEKGKHVEIVTRWPSVGAKLFQNQQFAYTFPSLFRYEVRMTPYSYLKRISPKSVVVYNVFTNEEQVRDPIDTVVMVTGKQSNRHLYQTLDGKVPLLIEVGDCLAPRDLGAVTYEAHKLMRTL